MGCTQSRGRQSAETLRNIVLHHARENPGFGKHGFLKKRFSEFLRCADPERACFVLECPRCEQTEAIPMRCKQRGLCPRCTASATARTMQAAQGNLVPAAYRHWVVNYPLSVTQKLAFKPKLALRVERIAYGCIFDFLQEKRPGFPGGMIARHRAGADLTLLFHNHLILADGTFSLQNGATEWAFVPCDEFTKDDLQKLAQKIWEKLKPVLAPHGLDVAAGDSPYTGDEPLAGMMARYRGLHIFASKRIEAGDQQEINAVLKYIFRPLIEEERLSLTASGLVRYKLAKPMEDGERYLTLTVEQFIQRVGSLLHRKGAPISRYIGTFASGAPNRKQIIRPAPKTAAAAAAPTETSEPVEWLIHQAETRALRPRCKNQDCFWWVGMRCIAVCNTRQEIRRFFDGRNPEKLSSPGS